MNTDTMDDYTLTTGEVRHEFGEAFKGDGSIVSQAVAAADNRAAFDRWLAAHDAEVRAEVWGSPINVVTQNDAAFALYKHDHPESIAKSWETVGLPIVLDYRMRANVVLATYFTAIRSQATEMDETKC